MGAVDPHRYFKKKTSSFKLRCVSEIVTSEDGYLITYLVHCSVLHVNTCRKPMFSWLIFGSIFNISNFRIP